MAWHLHLNSTTPNSLLTNAFLIISVINVSYCAIRLISHMQSIGSPWTRHEVKREIKGPKDGVPVITDYKHRVQKRQHTCIIHIFYASHAIVLPSAVLWHMCVTISSLNSCLIIPNLREYSNKAFNAFFHMILRRRDSCSAAFSAMFRKGTDSSACLIGEEVWERTDLLQTSKMKTARRWEVAAWTETCV